MVVGNSRRSWEVQTGLIIFRLTQTFPARNGPRRLTMCGSKAAVLEGFRGQGWGEVCDPWQILAPSTGQCVGLRLTSLLGTRFS